MTSYSRRFRGGEYERVRAELPGLADGIGGPPAALSACLAVVGQVALLGVLPRATTAASRPAPASRTRCACPV